MTCDKVTIASTTPCPELPSTIRESAILIAGETPADSRTLLAPVHLVTGILLLFFIVFALMIERGRISSRRIVFIVLFFIYQSSPAIFQMESILHDLTHALLRQPIIAPPGKNKNLRRMFWQVFTDII